MSLWPWALYLALAAVILFWVFWSYSMRRQLARRAGKLSASEAQKRLILDSIRESVIYIDTDHKIVWANRAAAETAIIPSEELAGRKCSEVWRASEDHCKECPAAEVMENSEACEEDFRTDSGRIRRICAYPVIDESGATVGAVEIVDDVTEERNAEAENRKLARMLDEYPNPVLRIAANGRLEYANPAAEPLLEMLACRAGGVVPEEWRAYVRQALEKGQGYEIEIAWDGKLYSIIIEPGDQNDYVNFYGRDITKRKAAESQLSDFKRTLDLASYGVCSLTLDSRFIYVNRAFAAMHGYDPEDIIGQPVNILHNEDQMPRVKRVIEQIKSEGGFNGEEVWHSRRDGSTFPMQMNATLIRNPEGEPTHFTATGTDITDKKNLELQLRHNQKMEAVGRLAGGVAHDFNNLLTGISGFAQLAETSLPKESGAAEDVEEIKKLAERASELTGRLLAFGRKQPLKFDLVDMNALIADMVKLLKRLIGEHIKLVFNPGEKLGDVHADPGQLEQVLVNLAVNARDAMQKGGALTIATSNVFLDEEYATRHDGSNAGEFVMLSVSDTGCGMTPDVKERLFEPYFTTKPVGQGAGLCLPTVYGIVKQHGGNIWVYSEPGGGTTFKIYLPLAESGEKDRSKRDANIPQIPRGHETILVAEDEESVRSLVCRALKRQGYNPISAPEPLEAEEIFQRRKDEIALLLTDVVMPGSNGHELYERLSADKPELKVIFMSGYDESGVYTKSLFDMDARFMNKPFRVDEMLLEVRKALDARE